MSSKELSLTKNTKKTEFRFTLFVATSNSIEKIIKLIILNESACAYGKPNKWAN